MKGFFVSLFVIFLLNKIIYLYVYLDMENVEEENVSINYDNEI